MKRSLIGLSVLSACLLAAALGLVVAHRAPAAPHGQQFPQRIEVEAQPIDAFDPRDPSRRRFGTLEFRGGLVLNSSAALFGGLSSLRIAPDGERILALVDRGYWFGAHLLYRDGRPAAVTDAQIAPVLGADGRPLNRRGWYDTESLAAYGNRLYVGIERVHQIVRFEHRGDGLPGRGHPIAVPPGIKALPSNKSLECLAVPPRGQPYAGTLIAISERGLDPAGNILGFLVGRAGGTFTVRRSDEFDISDCTVAPNGDLLLLERRFSWLRGVAMRIRRVPLTSLHPGAVLDGPQLIFADMGHQVDNMEGIAVHRAGDGTLVLTLVSDDNFSPVQRTLLLQFGWSE